MTIAACTLFEGDYHHGVATLVNSLVRNGFRGRMFAGYRGPLPSWAARALPASVGGWSDARVLPVAGGCDIVFLQLVTDAHFTNIKPDFMLSLFEQPGLGLDNLFYLDPDICLVRDWSYIADWATCGVALCEDVNSPLGEHHPRRVGWRRYFGDCGIELRYVSDAYVNGGCVGVGRGDLAFLANWKLLTEHMGKVIGGLSAAKIGNGAAFAQKGFASCFDCSDQDALNAAVQTTRDTIFSVLPRSAMAFERGDAVLPHALGPAKPWRRRYLSDALLGRAPGAADKAFWAYADGPVTHMPSGRVWRTRAAVSAASGLSRVYRRR